jgi:hypothetical protein
MQAADPDITESDALLLIRRRDLPPSLIEQLAANKSVLRHRRVLVRLAAHPNVPRHIALRLLRGLHTFELLQVALTPEAVPEIKDRAEVMILSKLPEIAAGERISLAKRGTAGIASALLLDADVRVIQAALVNPHLTETGVTRALRNRRATPALRDAVSQHPKWAMQMNRLRE